MGLDAEFEARQILRLGGYGESDIANPVALAETLLGDGSVGTVPARVLRGARARLVTVYGQRRIFVSRSLSRRETAFAILHEIGHWRLDQIQYAGINAEAICDAIAACLIAPREPFLEAVEEYGPLEIRKLAEDFAASETLAVLRVGEVTQIGVAVFDDERTHIRGKFRLAPGLAKINLADKPRRYALLAT